MKNSIFYSLSLAFFMVQAMPINAGETCTIEASDKPGEYLVITESGASPGYIALEKDGRWFVWINGLGAVNQTFPDQESALATVCKSTTD